MPPYCTVSVQKLRTKPIKGGAVLEKSMEN